MQSIRREEGWERLGCANRGDSRKLRRKKLSVMQTVSEESKLLCFRTVERSSEAITLSSAAALGG